MMKQEKIDNMIVYPQLNPSIRLKKGNNHVVLYGNHPSQLSVLHPSEAFVLNFCTGKLSFKEINYLYGYTYHLSKERALKDMERIIHSNKQMLSFNDHAVSTRDFFNDPTDFLFCVDEKEFQEKKDNYFLAGINLSLTLKCNFNCKYCYQALNISEEKLGLNKCLSLVDEAAENNLIHFGLTGGEPTLFKGWIDLIRSIVGHGMIPNITSNGTVIGTDPQIARKLRIAGLEEITISLDASNADLHHYITNSVNSFDKVIHAIRYLLENNIRVQIKYVLSGLNVADLSQFIDFAVGLGVQEIGITNLEGGAIGSGANTVSQISKTEYNKVLLFVKEKAYKYANKCKIHPPNHSSCLMDEKDWFPCGGLSMGMSVFPNGDVTVCDKLFTVKEFTYGNVFKDSIYTIWNSDALQRIRNNSVNKGIVDKDCSVCTYLQHCKTGCFVDSFNAFGDYYKKVPRCRGPFFN
jgi:radical SAM protein with 4Fe4S-binding SPASM domain